MGFDCACNRHATTLLFTYIQLDLKQCVNTVLVLLCAKATCAKQDLTQTKMSKHTLISTLSVRYN